MMFGPGGMNNADTTAIQREQVGRTKKRFVPFRHGGAGRMPMKKKPMRFGNPAPTQGLDEEAFLGKGR